MRSASIVPLLVLAVVAGCTGRQEAEKATAPTTVESDQSCRASEIDWASEPNYAKKVCSGGFEYAGRCCTYGVQQYAKCPHLHRLGEYTETFVIEPTDAWCAGYRGIDGCGIPPYGRIELYAASHKPCDATNAAAIAILNKVKAMRDPCSVKGLASASPPEFKSFTVTLDDPSIPADRNIPWNCTVVVSNAGIRHDGNLLDPNRSDHGYLGEACADSDADPLCGPDTTSPVKYSECQSGIEGTTNAVDGTRNEQVGSERCAGLAFQQYGPPGESLEQFWARVSYLQRSAGQARCLSGEDLEQGNDASTRWNALAALEAPARSRGVETILIQHRQLLFEMRGEGFTSDQRNEAERLYTEHPGVQPTACTSARAPSLPALREQKIRSPLLQNGGFEEFASYWSGTPRDPYWAPTDGPDSFFDKSKFGNVIARLVDGQTVSQRFWVPPDTRLEWDMAVRCEALMDAPDPGNETYVFSGGGGESFLVTITPDSGGPVRFFEQDCRISSKYSWAPPGNSDRDYWHFWKPLNEFAGQWVTLSFSVARNKQPAITSMFIDNVQVVPAPEVMPSQVKAIDARLTMCDRLLNDHVSPALADLEATACSDVATLARKLPAGWQPGVFSAYAPIGTELLRKGFTELPDKEPATRIAKLQRRLTAIHQHYEALKGSEETPAARWRDASTVASALLRGAYANSVRSVDVNDPAAAVVDQSRHLIDGYAVDREIVNALFTNSPGTGTPPLTNAAALLVLADALTPMSNRIAEVDVFHDIGCRFLPTCRFTTELSQTHALLAAMADPEMLASNWARQSNQIKSDWSEVFGNVTRSYDQVVRPAVIDAAGRFSTAEIMRAPESSVALFRFATLVNASKGKVDSYAETGRFRSDNSKTMVMGLTRAKLDSLHGDIDRKQAALADATTQDEVARATLLKEQLDWMSVTNQAKNVEAQLVSRAESLRQAVSDLAGLRASASADQARLGEIGESYEHALRALEARWRGSFVLGGMQDGPFAIRASSAANAFYSSFDDISNFTLRGPYRLGPGNLLLVTAEGSWAPTCAVQLAYPEVSSASVETGPQGFSLSQSSSSYYLTGSRGESFDSHENGRVAVCYGISLNFPPIPLVGSGQTCDESTTGLRGSDFNERGRRYEKTAAFSGGLRVPGTPFPEYPAGALLAVKVKAGSTSRKDIVDVEVIHAPSTMVLVSRIFGIGADADHTQDVYLVANEVSEGRCTRASDPALTLTVKPLVQTGMYARHVQRAMAATHEWLENELRTMILPAGRMLPNEAAALQAQANAKLLSECSHADNGDAVACDLGTYDADLMQVFRSWVSLQINQAERQIEIIKLGRQLQTAVMELEALAAEHERLQRQSEVAWLLPAWTIRNLDTHRAATASRELAKVVENELYPFLVVKYPEVLTGRDWFDGIPQSKLLQSHLASLTSVDWRAEISNAARDANAAVELVQDLLKALNTIAPSVEETKTFSVAIAFPKPRALWDPNWSDNYVDRIYGHFDTQTSQAHPRYREVSPERAARLWDGIMANTTATFEILPEDLYQYERTQDGQGNSIPQYSDQLSCLFTVPVVRAIGLHVVRDSGRNDTMTAGSPFVNVMASPEVKYVKDTHLEYFRMRNPEWLEFPVPLGYGVDSVARSVFENGAIVGTGSNRPATWLAGEGLSPVGGFVLQAGARDKLDPPGDLEGILHDAVAVVVMFSLEIRRNGIPTWIDNCKR